MPLAKQKTIRKEHDGETNEKNTATGFISDAVDGFAIMCSVSSQTLGPLFSNRPWAAKSNANFQHEQKRQLRNEPNKYFVFKRYEWR
ncbi:MAG: hypothetical protein DMG98_28095 [Acidobacteria bacterium]|nr:MAG: hypothetical protein DMG98_28095 [Acidobacteriota bacterium]